MEEINELIEQRMKKLEEAYDIGYEDYFYGGDRCLIEWPEKIEPLLPEDTVRVNIEVDGETGHRIFEVTRHWTMPVYAEVIKAIASFQIVYYF